MSADILNDLLSSNPNEPASQGVILLLRAETKSEFKAMRAEIAQIDQKVGQLDAKVTHMGESVEMIAQQIAVLVGRSQ